MFSFLKQRCHITLNEGHKVRKITLPYSKATPDIVCHDAKTAIISLLTDSRIVDDDCLFFDNNPFQPPPDTINCVENLNTERAHTDSYRKYTTKPTSQVSLSVIFHIDAATTGQFSNSPVTAVKFALEIFKRKSRDKSHL